MKKFDEPVDDLQRYRAEWARLSYIQFVRYVFKYVYRRPFRENWHHGYLAEIMTEAYYRRLLRFIINMPPRYSKSEMTTVCFDAWAKGRDPQFSLVTASYADELARDQSFGTRSIIMDPAYALVFPGTQVRQDQREKANWATTAGGTRKASGVGGVLTGKGGMGLLMDDPHKPLNTQTSDASRKKDIGWFGGTFYSRLDDKKKGFIGLVMQRLHDQDLTGHLLEQGDESGIPYEHFIIRNSCDKGQVYSIGEFQYERAPGALIWPAFEDHEQIAAAKVNMADEFAAQYEQEPIDDLNLFFAKRHFEENTYDYNNPPSDLINYGTSDFAVSEAKNDYTVHMIWGVDSQMFIYPLFMWREQAESDVWCDAMLNIHHTYRTRIWFGEEGQIEKSVGPFLNQEMRRRRIYPPLESFRPTGNKIIRAQSFRALHRQGRVRYPTNAPWFPEFQKELMRFPKGKNDDIVDNCSMFGLALDEIVGAVITPPKPKKSWRDRLRRIHQRQNNIRTWMRA